MTESRWKCCFVSNRVLIRDLSNRWAFEQRPKESKKISHVVILGNYMPETEKQLPRPGGAGLVCSRNRKKINISRNVEESGRVKVKTVQRGNEGETV